MSTIIVQALIEKTKDFSIEETFAFLADEYKNKVENFQLLQTIFGFPSLKLSF